MHLKVLSTYEDMREAESWVQALDRFPSPDFPKDAVEISYSRSSGPGGQHVNKTSTKATVRMSVYASKGSHALIPPYVAANLRDSSPLYTANPPSLLVSSGSSRSQSQNLMQCFDKLKSAIVEAASIGIVGETSEQQKQRVKALQDREARKMRQVKEKRKDVKSNRRVGRSDF